MWFAFFVPFFIMMLSSGRTVRLMLCAAGYLCHSTGYFYTPPRSRLNCLFFDAILSGPHVPRTPSSICPFPYAEGYTLSASRAAGGEPPLLKVHIGDTHLCTNSAARAAGGETPLLKVQRGDITVMHLCINSAARAAGGEPPPLEAPWRHAPAQVPHLERPRRAPPACLSALYARRATRYLSQLALLPQRGGQRLAPLSCPTHCRHTLFETPLGVPMWHACSRILCLFIVTMRPCAPSDISEEGSGYESG